MSYSKTICGNGRRSSGRSSRCDGRRGLRGFTLVELLVVVVIISMLVGLLLPAVMSARGRARIAQCTNNQKQLATAILGYETSKRRLPGYANTLHDSNDNADVAVGWIPVLLPFLDRNDLWKDDSGWRSHANTAKPLAPYIGLLVCPDVTQTSSDPLLTYVVNVGSTTTCETGVFRDRTNSSVTQISLSDIPSASRRPMISESLFYPGGTTPYNNREWNLTDTDATANNFGFTWPDDATIAHNTAISDVLPTIHPGIIIVTFCDGHTESIPADDPESTCDKFDYAPIE